MPLRHTPPPPAAAPSTRSKSSLQGQKCTQSASNTDSSETSIDVVTPINDDVQKLFMSEMKQIFQSHTSKCEERSNKTHSALDTLQNMMNELLKQNSEIKESIAFISKQYDDMKNKVDILESEKKADRLYIQQLEDRVDSLERTLNTKKIEIRNIPLSPTVKEEDLCKIVQNATNVIGAHIEKSEIREVYCTNKKDKASRIIVELTSASTKDHIIKKARYFNSTNKQNKLNSTHLNMDGPATPIYVSEYLPPQTQHLYYLARKFAKEQNYMYCWTSFGKIFLKKNDKVKASIIKRETDLENIIKREIDLENVVSMSNI